MDSEIEKRLTRLETMTDTVVDSIRELKNMVQHLATKDDVINMIDRHQTNCQVKQNCIYKDDFYSHFVVSMGKWVQAKQENVNRLALLIRNVIYIGMILLVAGGIFSSYYVFIKKLGG